MAPLREKRGTIPEGWKNGRGLDFRASCNYDSGNLCCISARKERPFERSPRQFRSWNFLPRVRMAVQLMGSLSRGTSARRVRERVRGKGRLWYRR